MQVTQAYEFVNAATQEVLGETGLINEDLSNLVDVGNAVFNANAMDKYVASLVNRIGRVQFYAPEYKGKLPSLEMSSWEYGSVLQRVYGGLPDATVNYTWELEEGVSYDPFVFHPPKAIRAKFYNDYCTIELDVSYTEEQVKCSFANGQQLGSFISLIFTQVENSITIKKDALKKRVMNSMIGETIHADYGTAALSSKTGTKAINLLYMYNNEANPTTPLTVANCMLNPEFIRFCAYKIGLYTKYIEEPSVLFNIGGQPRFTYPDDKRLVLLSDFLKKANAYLYSDTFHDEYVKIPHAEEITYWQGSGTNFGFADVSKVDMKINTDGATVTTTGVLGVLFDKWSCSVCNVRNKVTNIWNPSAEYFTNFYKHKVGLFNDLDQNFIVFFIA